MIRNNAGSLVLDNARTERHIQSGLKRALEIFLACTVDVALHVQLQIVEQASAGGLLHTARARRAGGERDNALDELFQHTVGKLRRNRLGFCGFDVLGNRRQIARDNTRGITHKHRARVVGNAEIINIWHGVAVLIQTRRYGSFHQREIERGRITPVFLLGHRHPDGRGAVFFKAGAR